MSAGFDATRAEGHTKVAVRLTVKLFASFQRGRFVTQVSEYADSPTIGEIVDSLAIPRAEVGVMMVNGRNAEFGDRAASDGVVAIFPVIGGG
jgi:molybdopterin converting factor small subunit